MSAYRQLAASLFALCLALNALVGAQSQPPTPIPAVHAGGQQQQTDRETAQPAVLNEAPSSGVTVNVIGSQEATSPISKAQQREQDSAGWRDWLPNWIIALFTVVTALVANAQRIWAKQQAATMRDGLAETRIAAKAAQDSADVASAALRMAHRPRLIVRPITVDGLSDDGRIGSNGLTNGQAWITNTGTTPTTLLRFHAAWLFASKLPLNNPAHTSIDTSSAPSEVKPGHFGKRAIPDYPITMEVFKAINDEADIIHAGGVTPPGHESLFLVGYIKHQDDIGLRRTFFCYRYSPGFARFEPVDHPSYNYEE